MLNVVAIKYRIVDRKNGATGISKDMGDLLLSQTFQQYLGSRHFHIPYSPSFRPNTKNLSIHKGREAKAHAVPPL
jgi:hypothetical protein